MDWQLAFNLSFSIALLLAGWVLRVIWDGIQRLTIDLRVLESKLPETYARRDDVSEALKDIKEALIRIEQHLDSKMDK
jgi:hypothetical protein